MPNALAKISDVASCVTDPPGMLLTREQRTGRAADVIGSALAIALLDHGWRMHFQPGEFYLESEHGERMLPWIVVEELRNGNRSANSWLQYCQTHAIGDWKLACDPPPMVNAESYERSI